MSVPPVGSKKSKIAIVGEAPGADEVRAGEPFIGSAGKLLNQILRLSGISRTECYLTNLSKERPKGNNFKARFYKKGKPTEELKNYTFNLREELSTLEANVIVPLGNEALKAITGKSGIETYRGCILNTPFGKTIPTIHPAACLRRWAYFPYMLCDFNRIQQDSEFPELRIPEYNLITSPTFKQAMDYLDSIEDKVAFDIEVTNRQIDMVSFCDNMKEAICIPFLRVKNRKTVTPNPYWSHYEERQIWRRIDDLLENPEIGKIAQNANFDIAYMEKYGVTINNLWMDTMNAQHTVYPEMKKGLDTLQSIYTRIPYHKDLMQEAREKYNALDSLATYHAAMGLEQELKDFGTHSFYHNYVKQLVEDYRDLSNFGIKVDKERQEQLEDVYATKEAEVQEKINQNCPWELDSKYEGVKLNPRSPQQLKEYFYNLRNYYTYRKNGKPTTNEEALKRLARKYPDDPIPELVLEARGISKTLGTYVRAPIDPDGRMRCTIKVSGTVTGRVATSKSINKTGTNLQNIQKGEVRSMFVPSHEDWVLTEGDYSGADAMVVAYLSRDPGLIKMFNSDRDYHATNTYLFFDECEVENPDFIRKSDVDSELRQKSKAISHGSNYGRSSRAIALDLRVSEKEMSRKQNKYFSNYPGIKDWHRRTRNQLKNGGVIETPFGRKRHFFKAFRPGKMSPHVLFEALSYIPQSTVGDLTHKGFINLKKNLPDNFPANILITVHDSILVENDPKYQEELEAIMKDSMLIPFDLYNNECIIPVDFETGKNWSDL